VAFACYMLWILLYCMFVRNNELLRCKACAVSRYCSRGCQARNCF